MTSTADAPVVWSSDGAATVLPPAYPVPAPDRFTAFVLRLVGRAPTWTGPAAIASCLAGAVGYTVAIHPTSADASSVPTCLVKLTTGFDCPGCGGTRAFWYVLHGNIPAAARHHALFVFALPFLLYMYVAWAAGVMFNRQLPQFRLSGRTVAFFLAGWTVFSVLRNLPWAPFTWFYV